MTPNEATELRLFVAKIFRLYQDGLTIIIQLQHLAQWIDDNEDKGL